MRQTEHVARAPAAPVDHRPASADKSIVSALCRSPSARVGGALVLFLVIAALVGPAFAPYDPLEPSLEDRLRPPDGEHWLGTDALGRDILSRMLAGARLSLSVGVIVGLVAVFLGVPIGIVAGFKRGLTDEVLMRPMDLLLSLPGLLLAIAIVALMGPGLVNALIAIGIVAVPSFARVARASTLRIRAMPFVEAARAVGGTTTWILLRHVLPNGIPALLVLLSIRVATGLLTAASLGFLGLGAQAPEPEWGAMLSDGRLYLRSAPHVTLFPGLAVMLAVLGFNLLGDGLRDSLDVRLKQSGS